MLGIRIGTEYLDFPQNFKIRLRLENTLFKAEYSNSAYTFPASVPDSDKNRRLLNYASDVQVKSTAGGWIACVLVCGALEWDCLLLADRSLFNKSIQISLKVTGSQTGKKMLTDLEYGGVRNTGGDDNGLPEPIETTNNYTRSADRDYYWGMYFNNTGNLIPDYGIINDIDITGTFDVVSSALGLGNTNRFTPMPYLNYVLRKIAADMGVPVDGNWWRDDELDSLVIFNNRTVERYFVAPTPGWVWRDLNLKYHLPVMLIDEFIMALKNMFCLMVESHNGKFTISSFKDILADFKVNDWTTKSHRVYERTRVRMDGYEIKSSFDPEDKLYDAFVKELKELGYKGSSVLPPASPLEGDYYFNTDYKNYYIYKSGNWELYSFAAHGVKSGNGELVFETPMTTPIFRCYDAPPLGERLPWVDMDSEGIYSEIAENDVKNFGPRLAFARGWFDTQIHDPGANLIQIPVISGEAVDFNGTTWGSYCLRYGEEEGLYNVWWKDFLDMAVANDVNFFDLEMTDMELSKWTFGEMARIGGEVFVGKVLDVELGMNGVEGARLECMKLASE